MSKFPQIIVISVAILFCDCSKKNIVQFQKSSVENYGRISKKQNFEKKIIKREFIDTLSINSEHDSLLRINFYSENTLMKVKNGKKTKTKLLNETVKNPDKYQKLSKISGILGMSSFTILLLSTLLSIPFLGEILILGGLAAILGIVFGIISIKKVRKKTMAKLGILFGVLYFVLIGAAVLLLLWFVFSIFNSIDIF